MTIALTTAARVNHVLQLNAGTGTVTGAPKSLIDDLIAEVSADIERELHRETTYGTYTEVLDVAARQRKWSLKAYPVASITSVKSDPGRGFGGSIDALDATLYTMRFGEESHLLHIEGGLSPGIRTLQVVYVGGMAADTDAMVTAYPDLVAAATWEVVNRFRRRDSISVTQVNSGADQTFYDGFGLLQDTKRRIHKLKRIVPVAR